MKFQYPRRMDAFDVFIPEIVQSATEWVEHRYGRFAGWLTLIVFLVGVPLTGLMLVIAFVALQKG